MKIIRLFIALLFCYASAYSSDSTKYQFLPEGKLFQPIVLDPIQPQLFGTITTRWQNYQPIQGEYIPFGIGINTSILRWQKKTKSYELGLMAGAFAQFEWKIVTGGIWQRNLLNSDYLAGLLLNIQHNEKNTTRIRMYHISTHNGDDYMIRNDIESYTPNANNYEQLDVIHSYTHKKWRLYGGLGLNIRPETIRKRLCFELGFEFRQPLLKNMDLFIGSDIKSMQQNGFTPGFKNAVGLALKNNSRRNLYFLLEYYQGHLPYSQFEEQRYAWLGAGLYFTL